MRMTTCVRLMAALAIICNLLTPPAVAAPRERKGFAAHYRPGLMEKVSKRRGMPVVRCMVASPHHKLGAWVLVRSTKNKQERKCRVTDVPRKSDRPALIRRNIVVELDYKSAKVLCGIKYAGHLPPRACPVIVTTLK